MNKYLVVTALGEDRPGIVDDLSRILLTAELNIEDSRMSILGGEFAIILMLSGSTDALNSLEQRQSELENSLQLKLLFRTTEVRQADKNKITYKLNVVGMDHPGIVQRLTGFLSQHHINIETLHTDSYPAPHTGTPMFAVHMTVAIPDELETGKLRSEFIEICDEQNLDADFTPLES